MSVDKFFLGRGWSFPPEFTMPLRKEFLGIKMVSADDDIKESLGILLSTTPGERTMHPTYGCNLKRMVFRPINESTLTEIRDYIERAVLFFETRIKLQSIEFNTKQADEGVLHIILNYLVISTNNRSNMVYPFYIKEGTNINSRFVR